MFDRLFTRKVLRLIRDKKQVICLPCSEPNPREQILAYNLRRYLIMAQDVVRVNAYQRAIEEKVRDKSVLEVGTGALALLAKKCVVAGAKKVYAIEANRAAYQSARRILHSEGLTDKIQLIWGDSQQVELPEKVDVLLHDVVGSMGSNEGMVSVVQDAKIRHLKANAEYIPEVSTTYIVPVSEPSYSGPLGLRLNNALYWLFNPPKMKAIMNFPPRNFLATPSVFERHNFSQHLSLQHREDAVFSFNASGVCDGLLLWVKLKFSDGNVLDCLQGTSWCSVFLPFCGGGQRVDAGDKMTLHIVSDLEHIPAYRLEPVLCLSDGVMPFEAICINTTQVD